MKCLGLALCLSLALTQTAYGDLVELSALTLTARSYQAGGYNQLITGNGLPDKALGTGFGIDVDLDVFDYFYVDALLHATTDRNINPDGSLSAGQFRAVGLETRFGVDLRRLDLGIPASVGLYHHSQHVLDHNMGTHYPVEDALEIKVYLYEKKGSRR